MTAHRFASAFTSVFAITSAIIFSFPCLAQNNSYAASSEPRAEAEGCAELKEVPKLPGAVVVSCDKGDSMEVTMPLKPDEQGYARDKSVRGAYDFREYKIPQTNQQEQAFDNLMQLLPMAGYSIKFSSNPSMITARKADTWTLFNVSGEYYDVKVVRANEEAWTPLHDAKDISLEFESQGRAAIYGISFSPDNQTIQEEKSAILSEVLKFLKANPALAIQIESHKNSSYGNPEDDMEITRKRANAVSVWLEAHGVGADRLQPKAMGRNKPITENDTPLEIQRNERIEIVKATP
jgi:outer membrane protein OmpA-like peptidoglycan-associated protein